VARSLEAPGSMIALWWKRLSKVPFGRTIFSIMIGWMVPYTGSIGARCEELGPGYSRWTLRDRRRVRNHLRSVHAVALVNLAEVSSGTAMLTALGPGVRGIVTGLEITYIKKARGLLTAEGRGSTADVRGRTDVDATAEIKDASGEIVAKATVHWRLERAE
jgi:acyl-coenzyme A thioesterase PaaI-like protein